MSFQYMSVRLDLQDSEFSSRLMGYGSSCYGEDATNNAKWCEKIPRSHTSGRHLISLTDFNICVKVIGVAKSPKAWILYFHLNMLNKLSSIQTVKLGRMLASLRGDVSTQPPEG